MNNMNKLTKKIHRIKELERMIEELSTESENLKNDVKSIMTEQKVDELSGDDWKVTWKMVSSNRFNQSVFKEAHPDLYESFKTLSESRRFIVK